MPYGWQRCGGKTAPRTLSDSMRAGCTIARSRRVTMSEHAPVRVLHVIDSLGLGGAQTFLFDLVLEQRRKGRVAPTVCCLTEPTWLSERFEKKHIPLFHLNAGRRNPFQIASIPPRLCVWLRRNEVNLVHTHLFVSGAFGRLAAIVTGLPVVVHEQLNETEIVTPYGRWIDHILGKRTGAVICVSQTTKDFNVQTKGIDPGRIWVIPNSINPERFSVVDAKSQKQRLLADLDLPNEPHLVIGIGRLEPQKRFDLFLQVAARVHQQMPDVHFLVVGEGSLRRRLEGQSAELGLQSVVRFTGARSDVPDLLGISDLFLLTSDFEGLPLTLLEALAMQVPAVATNVDGTAEVLGGGKGGVLVPPGDSKAMAATVLALLRDAERRQAMGFQGRHLVECTYGIVAVNDQVDGVYRDVLWRDALGSEGAK
jgi:glycosyltransferase involved in cell wall biosynthesis